MGQQLYPHYTPDAGNPVGAIVSNFVGEAILAAGDTAPADGLAGYGEGCIFAVNGAAADLQFYINIGSGSSCNFDPIPTSALLGVAATAAEINLAADLSAQAPATVAGAGITDGAGTIYKRSLTYEGNIKKLTLLIDLTDLASSTTDLDIIGTGTSPAYLTKILAAEVGTVFAVDMKCLEAPAGGVADIDLYSANEATGKFDDAVTGLTETALITAGGAWTNGASKGATVVPPANDYLYLTGGAGGTAATYTAGKFKIDIYGY